MEKPQRQQCHGLTIALLLLTDPAEAPRGFLGGHHINTVRGICTGLRDPGRADPVSDPSPFQLSPGHFLHVPGRNLGWHRAEAWGGEEAISQMSQQELKIIPPEINPNHSKWGLFQIASFPAILHPQGEQGGCRAIPAMGWDTGDAACWDFGNESPSGSTGWVSGCRAAVTECLQRFQLGDEAGLNEVGKEFMIFQASFFHKTMLSAWENSV